MKGTNSYLTRIIKKIPQIRNLGFIFPGFLCNLELAKGRITELKRLIFVGFLYKENEIIILHKNLFQEILSLYLLYRAFGLLKRSNFHPCVRLINGNYKWVITATRATLINRKMIISIWSHLDITECPLTKWGEGV